MAPRFLLAWLQNPSTSRGIHFGESGERWNFWTYERLAAMAERAGAALSAAGIGHKHVVSLVLPSGPEFVATFFGALIAGATPSPASPPSVFQDPAQYARYIGNVLTAARPDIVVADRRYLPRICDAAPLPPKVACYDELCAGPDQRSRTIHPEDGDIALLQFTSGSSGLSSAVRVPYLALETNIKAIHSWLHWTADDPFASWLPLHHDMGLIGALLCATVAISDLWLLSPEHFIQNPARYLRCFGEFGAKLTVTASFGVDYIVRRVSPKVLAGMDFSQWRGMVVGAEKIDARALEQMHHLLSPFGFRRSTFLPAYGMSEATLAITGLPLEEGWSEATVAGESLALGRRVLDSDLPSAQTVVGCGRPLDGVQVTVVGENSEELEEEYVGEIVARGASIAAGYRSVDESLANVRFEDGLLHTGDAGFFKDGQLYVIGRLGDSLKVRGRIIFGEDLECAAWRFGVARERVAALLGVHEGRATAVLILENIKKRPAGLEAAIRRHAEGARIIFIEAPRGTVLRTTSGKPKRRELWRAFTNGLIPGAITTSES